MRALLIAAFLAVPAQALDLPALLKSWGLPAPESRSAVPAVKGRPVIPLRGYLSIWGRSCTPDCGLPVPLLKNDPVESVLPLPEKPGEFRSVRILRDYAASGLKVKADFYALCPPSGCADRYFNVQVELSGSASALCSMSVNEADMSPFPVLACGGAQSGGRRLGVSFHRAALP